MEETLKTERLVLRQPVITDAARMSQLLTDMDIVRMTCTIPYPYVPLAAEFWIMQHAACRRLGTSYGYAITKDGGEIMGVMDLFTNADGDREVGYWLGRPYWGNGYITEAAQAVIEEGFRTFDIDYIDAGYFYDNPASGRVLEKLGFERKDMGSNLYSVARGERAAGIELRLPRPATIKPIITEGQDARQAASTA
ncbi:MAG: GNAT family N-acetyltransferase [Hyphomonadaceae bacterium]|nr:GNAT family N-acetyltransferase [Hyphomonadaceae bacterium]